MQLLLMNDRIIKYLHVLHLDLQGLHTFLAQKRRTSC